MKVCSKFDNTRLNSIHEKQCYTKINSYNQVLQTELNIGYKNQHVKVEISVSSSDYMKTSY